jgi:hypothetical protein
MISVLRMDDSIPFQYRNLERPTGGRSTIDAFALGHS